MVRVALFKGPDAFLRSAYTDRLRDAIEKSGTAVDLIRFDGRTCVPAAVLDECRSFGLMAQHKLVIVDDADEFLKESGDDDDAPALPGKRGVAKATTRSMVEAYVKSPTEGATLVLRAAAWRPGNVDKLIPAVGIIEVCEPPSHQDAVNALLRRAKSKHGCALEPDAAELLVERLGVDLGGLVQELAKLAAFVGEGGTIGVGEVRELVGLSREDEAWDLQPVLFSGDADAAVTKLRELVEVSRVPELLLRLVLIDSAKKTHSFARGFAQGVPTNVLARSNWIKGAALGAAVQAAARRVPPPVLAGLLERAVEADFRGKTGQGDEVIALESLVVEFVGAVGK